MANNYFQFKKFRINQEGSAMKVCTDSCIFGAWVKEPGAKNILDIGTGTGLLALMIAQTHAAKIDAVEIDENAFCQAKENINNSPWKNNINVYHGNITDYSHFQGNFYEAIVCNPPFFKNHLHSLDVRKNHALHETALSHDKLISCVKRLISIDGIFYIMLPPWQSDQFAKMAEIKNLFPKKILNIKEKANKNFIRVLTAFSGKKIIPEESPLIIRNENNIYSDNFKELLKDYYLHL